MSIDLECIEIGHGPLGYLAHLATLPHSTAQGPPPTAICPKPSGFAQWRNQDQQQQIDELSGTAQHTVMVS